ncbi:DUF2442 domain-containing protein [Pseudoduganella aquatica]|uniref:DUF2442 domain-containing protein n=1 Tax=Pseudoduganella aquatica TaxID=2660641 RepID=A0A7X4HE90_9BURK|nr:DUF2442 domain-containing protein [Pseudoduganella aquatica]MYN08932.1 DUF2442 domain-containing protein [Pseudoduganella aquatica]
MLPAIVAVAPLPNYRLSLKFANGESKTFDMQAYLDYAVYRPLLDKQLFAHVYIEGGTVAWSDAIDMAPETLYLESR